MVFSVIIPIFLILTIGYLSVKFGLLSKAQMTVIGSFVIKIALPALILQTLSTKKLETLWQPELFYTYSIVTAIMFLSSLYILQRYFHNSLNDAAILGIGASMSNTALLGTAILSLLIGHEALLFTSLVVVIESIFLLPCALLLAGMKPQETHSLWRLLKINAMDLFKNPLFIGVVLGVIFAIFQIKLPDYLDQVLLMIGHTASPLALYVIGGSMAGISLKYLNVQSYYLVISSNIIFPVLMYLALRYIAQAPMQIVYVGTLIASLPMPTVFGLFGQVYGLNDRTLTPLLMSTIFGFMVSTGLILMWWS